MKNFKTTYFYLLVVVLVGGYIYFFERGPAKKPEDDKKVAVLDRFVADEIQSIQVEDFSNSANVKMGPILMTKGDKDVWTIDSPKHYKADEATIRSLLTGIGDMNPETTIEAPSDLKQFGLDPPQGKCTLKSKSGQTFVLLVGNKAIGGSTVYVRPGDKNKVYLVGSYAADNLHKGLDSYRDRFFFKTDSVLARKVRVVRDGKTASFERDKGGQWNIVAPIQSKADTNKVRDLLNTISSLRIEEFVTDHPTDLKIYGLSSPHIRIEVQNSDSSGTHSILIGRKKLKTTNLYAKSGEEPYVGLVGEYIDKSLDLKIDDYRDKTALQFDGGAVKNLVVRRGSASYAYQKDVKGAWTCPGRPNADNEAKNLIDQLASETVLEFPPSDEATGLKEPVFQVEVTLADGSTANYRFGRREQGKVFVSSSRSKDVYKIADAVVSTMEGYYNSILTPVAAPAKSAQPSK
ncbi:MAG TPA: DUF4340 domain-containing protein [bacterium]|nr:DUF4340 domain-containing protein [bacterium]